MPGRGGGGAMQPRFGGGMPGRRVGPPERGRGFKSDDDDVGIGAAAFPVWGFDDFHKKKKRHRKGPGHGRGKRPRGD